MSETMVNMQAKEQGLGLKEVNRLKLEWRKVTVIKTLEEGSLFKKQKTEKKILDEVSGEANPGELLAIMGPSGGGKTSLLNTLSRRVKMTSGSILLNGAKLPKNFNKISAYVMQDDKLFETLTPRELFSFSANLRLPREVTNEEKSKAIEWVIQRLGLGSCADTRVGGALARGLSGGERKRTSIGYELITNPSLLFLDEPTTGLDSYSSLTLLECLRDLARDGHTIICTIHQPSSEIFALFDKLTLLAKGKVAYHGEAIKSIDYFERLGHPCPKYSNPADHFMKVLQTHTESDIKRVEKIVEEGREINQAKVQEQEMDIDTYSKIEADIRAPFYRQFIELSKRGWITQMRNPLSFQARLVQNVVVAILVGFIFFQLGYNQANIGDRFGVLFFIGLGQILSAINGVVVTFPLERNLLVREYSNGMYSITSYYLGKMVSTVPFDIFFPVFFSLICYWMIGLNSSASAFFLYLLSLIVTSMTAGSIGLFLGCLFPNAEVAVSLVQVVIIPFLLFAGFYVDLNSIPVWLSWIQYISIFKWSIQALLVNEFSGVDLTCLNDELISVASGNQTIMVCPITKGEQVLKTNGYESFDDYWIAVGVMASFFVVIRIFSLFILTIQTKRAISKNQ